MRLVIAMLLGVALVSGIAIAQAGPDTVAHHDEDRNQAP